MTWAHLATSEAAVPVACTGGWLRLRCHADFDPAGILIVRFLGDQVGAEPWGMTAERYLDAVERSSVEFSGSVAETAWDPALAEAMRAHRKAVFEEDVRHSLAAPPPDTGRGRG